MSRVTQRKVSGHQEDRDSSSNYKLPDLSYREETVYHSVLWLFIASQNIILDFGRPFLALLYTKDYFPLNMPSLGDYAHMLHNITMSFSMLSMLRDKTAGWLKHLLVTVYVMGASIHLVGDSINHRLALSGYKNYLSVEDNPIMQRLEPKSLVFSFQLLYFYDEYLGHFMWYLPLFFTFYLYYSNSFSKNRLSLKSAGCMFYLNLVLNMGSFWYLITEGQMIEMYLVLMTSFLVTSVTELGKGRYPDVNGMFILLCFSLTGILVAIWVYYLWDDPVLRARYPGVLYVPEPWSVVPMKVNLSDIFN